MDGEPTSRRISLVIHRVPPGAPEVRSRVGPILHSLPQPPDPDGGLRQVRLLRPQGQDASQFIVTCNELPGVAHCGGDEDEVLALTQLLIEEALRSGLPPGR